MSRLVWLSTNRSPPPLHNLASILQQKLLDCNVIIFTVHHPPTTPYREKGGNLTVHNKYYIYICRQYCSSIAFTHIHYKHPFDIWQAVYAQNTTKFILSLSLTYAFNNYYYYLRWLAGYIGPIVLINLLDLVCVFFVCLIWFFCGKFTIC